MTARNGSQCAGRHARRMMLRAHAGALTDYHVTHYWSKVMKTVIRAIVAIAMFTLAGALASLSLTAASIYCSAAGCMQPTAQIAQGG